MREKMHIPKSFVPSALSEALESRRLLAGIEAGVLVAQGTAGVDFISVRRSGGDDVVITTNGVHQTFDMDDFTGVRLEGLGGDDAFRLIDPLTSPVVRNTTVLGGGGVDAVSYATRTHALTFAGFEDADGSVPLPYLTATSGAQVDRIAMDVEIVTGGSGNDTFHVNYGGLSTDLFSGKLFTFLGREGNDTFHSPTELTAVLAGEGGHDTFFMDEGAQETVLGGDGSDRLFLQGMAGTVFDAGSGIDTLQTDLHNQVDMRQFANLENFDASSEHLFHVIGNELNNLIVRPSDRFLEGRVTFEGLGGDDTLIGGHHDDVLDGGEGNDSIVGGFGDDAIDGGAGTDIADGGPGTNAITNVEVQPPAGTIGIVNRILIADGKWGQDLITIRRTGSDNVIVHVNGLTREFDMDDFDGVLLRGNGGFDDLRADAIIAGSLVRRVTLEGGAGDDTLRGFSGNDVLRGGSGNDLLFGEVGRDALFGQGGNDTLYGGFDPDFMDGGDGDDFLGASDNAPNDTVLGGNGNDVAQTDPGDHVSGVERT